MTEKWRQIGAELQRLEREEQVRILYACESGSRAWGFASQDSDYDVRFIYIRTAESYLSIFDRRDVIERPIDDGLDLSGWDVRKALHLFRKSNPPLLEWLQSPVLYADSFGFAERMRRVAPRIFSPRSCLYHYLHMARGNYRTYLQGERVRIKKYFYVLRPVLACEWIVRFGDMPPIEFEALTERLLPDGGELRRTIDGLLARKRAGEELNEGPRLDELNGYLAGKLSELEQSATLTATADERLDNELDALFRAGLREAWAT